MNYDRLSAVQYAHKWAYKRNPKYFDFSNFGGDCTNFISQCLLAGGAKMNYKDTFGWYYKSADDRTPSWSGVEFFYNFLINNKAAGPYAGEVDISTIDPGDVVQLSFMPGKFSHTLMVVKTTAVNKLNNVLIATHTNDSDNRPLSSYDVVKYRFLKIDIRN